MGIAAKLARNLIQYASWMAAYEAQRLAEAAGVPLLSLATAVQESDKNIGGSSRLMFDTSVTPFGPDAHPMIVDAMTVGAGLAHKDLAAALALGRELGLELPLAAMTADRIDAVFRIGPDPQLP
jgi:3-hydroxyisobutyrate dehydrogenase